jgi:hypothetical protein
MTSLKIMQHLPDVVELHPVGMRRQYDLTSLDIDRT